MSSQEVPPNRPAADLPRRSVALSVIALVLSVAALGLATWTALRPVGRSASEQTHSADQQAAAKTAICATTDLVRKGVALNTNLQSPGGPGDVTGSLAVAGNARLSLSGGGQYLLARLDPATPNEVADAVKKFADTLMDIGAAATAGASNTDPDQAARLQNADGENAKLTELCK